MTQRGFVGRWRCPHETAKCVRHVTNCAFAGSRIVIFSGGGMISDDDTLLDEIRAIHAGGGFGSMIGRNIFQWRREDALAMPAAMMDIYAAAAART